MEYSWTTAVVIAASSGSGILLLLVVAAVGLSVTKYEVDNPKGDGNHKDDGNPTKSPQGYTIFIPFIHGTSASMSEQFVDHGGRTGGSAADGIADDLTAMVEKYEAKGYEFQKVETIHIDVAPGCIGTLMGNNSKKQKPLKIGAQVAHWPIGAQKKLVEAVGIEAERIV